jgi:hypothetical protein
MDRFILVVGALFDACVVRIMLVPALLSFGDGWNWWPGDACDAWWLRVRGYSALGPSDTPSVVGSAPGPAPVAAANPAERTAAVSTTHSDTRAPAIVKKRSVTDAAASYWAARASIVGAVDVPTARISLARAQVHEYDHAYER